MCITTSSARGNSPAGRISAPRQVGGGGCGSSYLTLDASQAAAARLGLAEALAVAAAVLPGQAQLVQLPFLLLVDLLDAGRLEERVALLGGIRVEDGARVRAGPAQVQLLLGHVVHRQTLGRLAVLRAVLGQLLKKWKNTVNSGFLWGLSS